MLAVPLVTRTLPPPACETTPAELIVKVVVPDPAIPSAIFPSDGPVLDVNARVPLGLARDGVAARRDSDPINIANGRNIKIILPKIPAYC